MRFAPAAVALLALLSLPQLAAAECDCDHVVEPETLSYDGSDVAPGESVCIRAGTREALRLSNIQGTEEARIVVRNCEGVVRIENSERGYGITLDTSEYMQLTGTGDGEDYGFFVRATRTGPDYSASGVPISGYNHHIEVDHIEVVDPGFAGFILKTDPSCDARDLRDHVQRNVELHHNVVRNPGGEDFYLGNTGYPSRTITCDGEPTEVFPHWHEGLSVHHNRVENAGWDGMQVAVARNGCHVYQNVLVNSGLEGIDIQSRGLQLGGGASCEVFGNLLFGGTSIGIFAIGSDDTWIYNNVVSDFAADGIYVNLERSSPSERSVSILHNTVLRSGEEGIQVFGEGLTLDVKNNVVLESATDNLSIGGAVLADSAGNVVEGEIASMGFQDESSGDLRLVPDSPLVNTGVALTGPYGEADADGVTRDSEPDPGAYEYTTEERPDPDVDTGPGMPTDDAGGCGCQGSPNSGGAVPFLIALAALAWRRRGSSQERSELF